MNKLQKISKIEAIDLISKGRSQRQVVNPRYRDNIEGTLKQISNNLDKVSNFDLVNPIRTVKLKNTVRVQFDDTSNLYFAQYQWYKHISLSTTFVVGLEEYEVLEEDNVARPRTGIVSYIVEN